MKSRHILTLTALLGGLLAASCLAAADESYEQSTYDKALVADGHVRHDVGSLHNHVTNWGLIGSRPSVPTPFSLAPSARWGGIDYLWAAGVWFGGTVLGERLVTTGQYTMEFQATDAPGDTIFTTAQGAPGGNRYPWPGADDDGDGAEDEDPLDGMDNDGDSLIDEDFAAASDQHFRCVMADNLQKIVDMYPDHNPLNLQVVQESFQWSHPLAADFIGYEYRVTNVGVADIEGFHCGIFADFDIVMAEDDHAASWNRSGTGLVRSPWGAFVPVYAGYMYDGAATGTAPGYVGFVMCGLETDAAAGPPANPLEMHSYQIFAGNVPFEQGGDPTNDAERYELLQQDHWDTDSQPGMENDYRTLMSTPAVQVLAPGETVVFRMAMVIGESLDDMLVNAAAAVTTAYGQSFDRDGDPGNGEEFHVPWLLPDEVPVPAVTGQIQARRAPGVLSLRFDVQHTAGGQTEISRRESDGVPFRTWTVDQGSGFITDDDAVGWPRTYDLRLKSTEGPDLVLDTIEVQAPAILPLNLEASPNPFNPRLTVAYSLPADGMARLEIIDLQGRLVRVLFDEFRRAGSDRVDWNGMDDRGGTAASGVYLVRLVTEQGFAHQQVTLLR